MDNHPVWYHFSMTTIGRVQGCGKSREKARELRAKNLPIFQASFHCKHTLLSKI